MKKCWKISTILLMMFMAMLSAFSAFAEDVPPEGDFSVEPHITYRTNFMIPIGSASGWQSVILAKS